jgi:RNA polymerase sigma-70 factor, ECF subfamily
MHAFTQSWQLSFELRSESPDRLMDETSIDDHSLLRRLARGEERAFSVVYERYNGPIHRFAWHMSGDRAMAEEITQEVFMLIIRKPRKYDPSKGSLGGYLFGIARNLTRRRLEQRRVNIPFAEEPNPTDEAYSISESAIDDTSNALEQLTRRELIEGLRAAVFSLPAQYREVIILCDLEQMSQASAAELLQCAPGTIASRMHRARAMLKMKMVRKGLVSNESI